MDKQTLIDISQERAAQDAKWGGQAHDDEHQPWDWVTFIGVHTRKANDARVQMSTDGYEKQLVRIAALAIAALESHRRLTKASDQ